MSVFILFFRIVKGSDKMTDRKAVIKNADMSEEMQQDAVDCATQVSILRCFIVLFIWRYNIIAVLVEVSLPYMAAGLSVFAHFPGIGSDDPFSPP